MKQTPQKHHRHAKKHIQKLKARIQIKKRWHDKAANFLTRYFGTFGFFIANLVFFILWIVVNTNVIPGIEAFDPYPFNFLTMFVSLEAIFLSVIVLVSQNKESEIADLRDELDFEINVRAEDEITKILNILDKIERRLGLPAERDAEFLEMEKKTNIEELEKAIRARKD